MRFPGRVAEAPSAELVNLGKNGASTSLIAELIGKTVELRPDLITIAFGMNDLRRYTPDRHVEEIASGGRSFRKALPFACVVVVTPMSGTPEWGPTHVETTRAFALRSARMGIEGKGRLRRSLFRLGFRSVAQGLLFHDRKRGQSPE